MTRAHGMCSWNALVAVLMKYTHELALMNYFSHIPPECAHELSSWNILIARAHGVCSWNVLVENARDTYS